MTESGEPYGPIRYKELVRERCYLAKSLNTSYIDTGKFTPLERKYMIQYLQEEYKKTQEALENVKANNNKDK